MSTVETRDGFLRKLLGSDGVTSFMKEVWQRRTLVFPHGSGRDLGAPPVVPEDIDELLCSVDFPVTNFNMADGEQPLPESSYAPGGVVNRDRVLSLHRRGATIILRAAQRWSGKLRGLCSRLEWDFGFPVQANIYVTPPAKKSTPPHWDTHDLFIVQVAGRKSWRLFSSEYGLPLDSQRFEPGAWAVGPLVEEIPLVPGDVFYLPRGTIHEPTADSHSIHVSLGVLVTRWSDLLRELVDAVAEEQVDFRRALDLPGGKVGPSGEEELVKRLIGLVHHMKDHAAGAKAVRRHLAGLLSQHGDCRSGHLIGAMRSRELTHASHVRRVPSAYLWVERGGGRIHIRWRRGQFSVPDSCEPFLEKLLGGEVITLHDAPGWGKDEEVIAFCQALLDQGLIKEVGIGLPGNHSAA